jgi:predicted transport protein
MLKINLGFQMPIYSINEQRLRLVKEKRIDLEKTIQLLTEKNLYEIFGLEFVSGRRNKEFYLDGLRIDTLGFDPCNKAFVIIEYKRDKSFSVVDQGYAYLSLMINNKADFVLEYNHRKKANLRKSDVDWSQVRVKFIAGNFTNYQRRAINFKDMPIHLWRVKLYENDTVLYKQVQIQSSNSIKTLISKEKPKIEEVSQEVKVYTLQDHLSGKPKSIIEIVEKLSDQILGLNSRIIEVPQKNSIVYRISKSVAELEVRAYNVRLTFDVLKEKLKDPLLMAREVRNISDRKLGETEIIIDDIARVSYAVDLIRQVLEVDNDVFVAA